MPTSIVKTVTFNREWQHPGTGSMIYYFDISFEDDTEGQFSTNKKDQNKFLVGQEYEYLTETKSGGKGDYLFINKPKAEQGSSPVPSKKWKRDPKVRKLIMAQSCDDYALEMIDAMAVLDKVQAPEDVFRLGEKFYEWVHRNASDNEQMEIILQSSIKKAIKAVKIPVFKIDSSDRLLEVAFEFRTHVLKMAGEDNEL